MEILNIYKNIENEIGRVLYKKTLLTFFIIQFYSIFLGTASYIKLGSFFISFFIYISIFLLTLYFLNNFIVKYSKKNLVDFIENMKLKSFNDTEILNDLSVKTVDILLEKDIIPTEKNIMKIFKLLFQKNFNLKINLKDYNNIYNNMENYSLGISEHVKEIYFKKKLILHKMGILKK